MKCHWLKEGEQTQITSRIKEISTLFKDKDLSTIKEILFWIKNNFKLKNFGHKIKRSRTADQIIRSKFLTGCGDNALVLIALCRAKKIPALFVETINENWLNDKSIKDFIEGHIFVKILLNDKIYLIDPVSVTISKDIKYIHNKKKHILIKEGLDSWDLGFYNTEDLIKFLKEKYNVKFKN